MDTLVYSENYKGCSIQIHIDSDAQSPEEWVNEDLFLITTNNRYFSIQHDGFDMDLARDGEYKKQYNVLPLYAYVHSGVALSLGRGGQFSDMWEFYSEDYMKYPLDKAKQAADLEEKQEQASQQLMTA